MTPVPLTGVKAKRGVVLPHAMQTPSGGWLKVPQLEQRAMLKMWRAAASQYGSDNSSG
jgi:hypothetical protein